MAVLSGTGVSRESLNPRFSGRERRSDRAVGHPAPPPRDWAAGWQGPALLDGLAMTFGRPLGVPGSVSCRHRLDCGIGDGQETKKAHRESCTRRGGPLSCGRFWTVRHHFVSARRGVGLSERTGFIWLASAAPGYPVPCRVLPEALILFLKQLVLGNCLSELLHELVDLIAHGESVRRKNVPAAHRLHLTDQPMAEKTDRQASSRFFRRPCPSAAWFAARSLLPPRVAYAASLRQAVSPAVTVNRHR